MRGITSRFLQCMAAVLALGAAATMSSAQTMNARGDGPVSAAEGQQVWNAVQQLPSASQGEGPVLYVIAYSTCPYTAAFFHDWNGKLDGVQVRWVFYGVDQGVTADNSADLALTRNPDIAAAIIQRAHRSPSVRSTPASVTAFNKVADGTVQLNHIFAGFGHANVISPTFVWRTGSQVFVARGYAKDTFERLILPSVKSVGGGA